MRLIQYIYRIKYNVLIKIGRLGFIIELIAMEFIFLIANYRFMAAMNPIIIINTLETHIIIFHERNYFFSA